MLTPISEIVRAIADQVARETCYYRTPGGHRYRVRGCAIRCGIVHLDVAEPDTGHESSITNMERPALMDAARQVGARR